MRLTNTKYYILTGLFSWCCAIAFTQQFPRKVLDNPIDNAQWLNSHLIAEEVRVFDASSVTDTSQVFLINGYAEDSIQNPNDWSSIRQGVSPTTVTIVFTKQPVNYSDWKTNYHQLLANRIKQAIALDSTLNSDHIKWSIILQNKETTTQKATMLPHGILIGYCRIDPQPLARRTMIQLTAEPKNIMDECLHRRKIKEPIAQLSETQLKEILYPQSITNRNIEYKKPQKNGRPKEPECPSFTSRAQKPKRKIFDRLFR